MILEPIADEKLVFEPFLEMLDSELQRCMKPLLCFMDDSQPYDESYFQAQEKDKGIEFFLLEFYLF